MKIKKYIIDQEIPKNIKASNLLRTVLHTGSGLVEFYFLVEEEKTPTSELSIIKGIENLEEDY